MYLLLFRDDRSAATRVQGVYYLDNDNTDERKEEKCSKQNNEDSPHDLNEISAEDIIDQVWYLFIYFCDQRQESIQ